MTSSCPTSTQFIVLVKIMSRLKSETRTHGETLNSNILTLKAVKIKVQRTLRDISKDCNVRGSKRPAHRDAQPHKLEIHVVKQVAALKLHSKVKSILHPDFKQKYQNCICQVVSICRLVPDQISELYMDLINNILFLIPPTFHSPCFRVQGPAGS